MAGVLRDRDMDQVTRKISTDITWLDTWKFHGVALLAGCVIGWIIGDPI